MFFGGFFFFGKPKSKASLPPGVYISYCTVWEGHDLTRCRRFPRINPSSPYPFCNLLRILYTHARRHGHTGTHTHTRTGEQGESELRGVRLPPDAVVIGWSFHGEGTSQVEVTISPQFGTICDWSHDAARAHYSLLQSRLGNPCSFQPKLHRHH